jgi:hypothetical protein
MGGKERKISLLACLLSAMFWHFAMGLFSFEFVHAFPTVSIHPWIHWFRADLDV